MIRVKISAHAVSYTLIRRYCFHVLLTTWALGRNTNDPTPVRNWTQVYFDVWFYPTRRKQPLLFTLVRCLLFLRTYIDIMSTRAQTYWLTASYYSCSCHKSLLSFFRDVSIISRMALVCCASSARMCNTTYSVALRFTTLHLYRFLYLFIYPLTRFLSSTGAGMGRQNNNSSWPLA